MTHLYSWKLATDSLMLESILPVLRVSYGA